ncbi:MAG: transketolase [Planctomycetota bacterium]
MVTSQASSLDQLCINAIRTLSIDAVERANSGHPGLPLGAAPMAYVLWQRHLKHDPRDPSWADRDRFVLSAGHGSMLIYSLLHLTGYDVTLDDLKAFRQWGSKTPGHPEYGHVPGVECTTGPLGQGCSNAVGMAMAERYLASRFNRDGHTVVDHFTYALVGDGDLMEGVAAEAGSLAGHLGLGKLIYLYDANDVTLDGPCDMHFTEDVARRYEAYGWHVQTVADGDGDLDAIDAAIAAARAETGKPSLIVVKTTIGFGSPKKAGSCAAHGAPLGADEVAATKGALGWTAAEFEVPTDAAAQLGSAVERGAQAHAEWNTRFEAFAAAHPELAQAWRQAQAGELPGGWDAGLPEFEAGSKHATRDAGGAALTAAAATIPWLFGGDADLGGSTKTVLKGEDDFDGRSGAGRNVRYGVREHAMAAIANGIAYHGGARTYTATFFVFSDYMRPALRLAAMNGLPVVNVFTHDSIGVGEDGPTHQPVEHLMSLRAIPNMVVLRPADAAETAEAWRVALGETKRPVSLVLSRQKLPTIDRATHGAAAGLRRGAYVLRDTLDPRAILIATGSEVPLALAAQDELASHGVGTRVVSMPSWELFADQDAAYRDEVLPADLGPRVSVEAGVTLGWERWTHGGASVGLDRFGASAPGDVLFRELGFTPEAVVRCVRGLLGA